MPITRRVLLLSFYYPPDLAAGSFRVEALAKALLAHSSDEVQIDVLTTQPNRYHSYNTPADGYQHSSRLTIRRILLPSHKNGMIDQVKAFTVYAWGVAKAIKGQEYDLIVASSSRLMTAALAAAIAFKKRTPLYLDIRDIFVDTLPELVPGKFGRMMTLLFSWMERLTIRQASRVNLISPGFADYFAERYPGMAFSTYTNGVDELFLKPLASSKKPCATQHRLKILYAGNIGAGQGLEHILPALAQKLANTAQFHIIGDGGSADKLRIALEQQNITNVELIAPTKRSNLIEYYRQADVLFLHLNTFKSFRRVLPSKLFEYAATGKPILAGLAGYAKQFTTAKIANACVFEPGDADGALQALERLSLTTINRSAFKENYSRTLIQRHMALDVLSTPRIEKASGFAKQRYLVIKRWAFLRLDWFISLCRYPVATELMAASLWG